MKTENISFLLSKFAKISRKSTQLDKVLLALKFAIFHANLNDDTIKEDLIYGNAPSDLKFDHNQWAKISLEIKKTK